ncbi:hypothetical protein [Thermus sediminis]|uniref:hypothetical protein n=1 Tax=Thermus sediminis TaxID=1761908 RepID=UPI000E3CCAB0|nr:hypothetical protein [Thermus sediminis]
MPEVYGVILETLRPHLGARAEAVLEEGLKRLGKRPQELSPKDGEALLKGLAFRELQGRLSPEKARRVVEEALRRLSEPPNLEALEAGLKRFGLYLDWPEVARLRALVNRLRRAYEPGLKREAEALLEALEERLEEALLRQAQDLAYLEESLERVRHLGGAKVRRLESLLATVQRAQEEGVLAQAEVERARGLALELRKLLESSVARSPTLPEIAFETQEEPPNKATDVFLTVEEAEDLEGELVIDLEALPEEAARRLEALEAEEERRRLEELLARYAPLLEGPAVSPLLAEVQALLGAGKPAGEKLSLLEAALKEAEKNLRAERRARLIQLGEALRTLPLPEEAKASLEGALRLAEETLEEGGLPDLKPLEVELARLEEEARRKKGEEKRLLEEKEALARELAQRGEAFRPLLEELQALAPGDLPQGLPRVQARYAALLQAQGEKEALKAKLLEAERELEALKSEASALGLMALGLEAEVREAEEALEEGRLPDLTRLRREVAEAKAQAQKEALEELSRLQSLAERFRGFGGEGVLRAIEEEKAKPLPDPIPIARALQALKQRLEAKREEVLTRLVAFFQAYGRLSRFQSETHRRLKPLLGVLKRAQERLPRLGPQGLLGTEKTLAQAEKLLGELEREAEAAKALLQEIRGADLEALLGVFEEGKPSPDLERLRLPGVEALGFLEENPPLPREALLELKRALATLEALLGEKGPAALLLGRKALVLAPFSGRTLVALMERDTLPTFLLALR